jgi:hypothetical protein
MPIGVVVVAGLIAACAPAGGTGTRPAGTIAVGSATSVPPPALVTDVAAPQHLYRLQLPAGWTASLGATAGEVDTFSGPEGSLSIEFVPIPSGTGQDAWVETYETAQIEDFAAGCFAGPAATWEPGRIGTEAGLLFQLPCLPGWMLLTAYGDRGYDLRFTSAAPTDPTNGKQQFLAILASFSFTVA